MALPCHCHELDRFISGARAVGQHVEWLQRSVQLLKYRDEFARAEHLAPLVASAIADLPPTDLIVPVPLHRKREQERGYNQALVLADGLSAEIGRPLLAGGAFVRRSNTPHQTGLSAAERRQNLVDAFSVANPSSIRGRSLLLVDDVMTSGATVGACAVSLRNAGARDVYVATVSRAINRTN